MAVARDILSSLTRRPRVLVDFAWLRWDAEGSQLFEKITEQDEYYLTRTERHILEVNADEIIAQAIKSDNRHHRLRVVELGAGTANKTGILLAALMKRQGPPVEFIPVDVSSTPLDEAKATLEQRVPGVHVTPQVCNYLIEPLQLSSFEGSTLTVCIGSSIGCFPIERVTNILQSTRRQLQPGDMLLIGVDSNKNPATLLAAYNDTKGIFAAFFLNTLRRLNQEFGFDFDLDQFRHRAVWNERESRVDVYLQSLCSQRVRCSHYKDQVIDLDKDEEILMGITHKFSTEQIKTVCTNAGFDVERTWTDENKLWTVVLARVPSIVA